MNLIYTGGNPLISSAVRRTSNVLNSSFFQKHLMTSISEAELLYVNHLIQSISDKTSDILIETYWNPFKKSTVVCNEKTGSLRINLANIKKSRRYILKELVKNYSLLELNKIHKNSQEDEIQNINLASYVSSLANNYA